jgi:uncharacterized repeat protein (TIGR03837 family)
LSIQCAIYCTVIDNFGDIGVCWRLARQLASEHDINVTLWIDDLISFSKLANSIEPHDTEQILENITVCLWYQNGHDTLSPTDQIPFDIIIEGFGCRLPDSVLTQMAQQAKLGKPPLWINLEYLSAESWAVDCHLMPSVHPQTGLVQHFWFPSFSERSGGLLCEADLIKQRDDFQNNIQDQEAFWAQLNISDAHPFERKISLFSYENTVIHHLLNTLVMDKKSTLLLVPEGKALVDISRWVDETLIKGSRITKDSLTILVLPFLNHHDYDRLLWACDLNFVRGEDSFVRAQWAGKPFIWHIYPQDDDTHIVKLNAFIETVASVHQSTFWQQSMLNWNIPNLEYNWAKALSHIDEWQLMAREWQDYLSSQSSLTSRLMQFFYQNTSRSDE